MAYSSLQVVGPLLSNVNAANIHSGNQGFLMAVTGPEYAHFINAIISSLQ